MKYAAAVITMLLLFTGNAYAGMFLGGTLSPNGWMSVAPYGGSLRTSEGIWSWGTAANDGFGNYHLQFNGSDVDTGTVIEIDTVGAIKEYYNGDWYDESVSGDHSFPFISSTTLPRLYFSALPLNIMDNTPNGTTISSITAFNADGTSYSGPFGILPGYTYGGKIALSGSNVVTVGTLPTLSVADLTDIHIIMSTTPLEGVPSVLRTVFVDTGNGPTTQITLNGYTGNPLVVGISNCEGSGCAGTSTAHVTGLTDSVGSSCTFVPNSLTTTTLGLVTQVWKCTGGSSGNDILTITCGGGGGCFFVTANVVEVSTISGVCEVGNHAIQTSQNLSISTNGPTTSTNEFIYSITNKRDEVPTSGQTSIGNSGSHTVASYQVGSSPATYANTWFGTVSADYAASIVACK